MRSTFMGLETARRGMFTQQSALYTTGHNISNANTPGFSRQRVNFQPTSPYPSIGFNSPYMPGQMGTGVEAGSVQRIRDGFLDAQYRTEVSKFGYYGSLSESLTKMEEIMNEPSDTGLHSAMEKFWKSLQDLASHTENSGARDVVAASGQMVADTLNYYYNSLTRVQTDIGNQIGVKKDEINNLIDSIDLVNKQIADVEPNGYLPNDLYDKRDSLVDQLSKLINIKVTNVKPTSYGDAKDIAEGLYNIEVVQADGKSYSPPINLVNVNKSGILGTNKVDVVFENNTDPKGAVTGVKFGNGQPITSFNFRGELAGLIESYGYKDGAETKGTYPDRIDKLNKMTEAFVNKFNDIHKSGYALGSTDVSTDNFFVWDPDIRKPGGSNFAQAIKVNEAIIKDPSKIAAAGKPGGASGDNENAQKLADIKTLNFADYGTTTRDGSLNGNIDTFYSGIIGKLGVDSQSAIKNTENSAILADSVEMNRQSVSAVSMDEEMTNMIKYQHAYNAAARNITVVDEMLDKIINGMGVVGR